MNAFDETLAQAGRRINALQIRVARLEEALRDIADHFEGHVDINDNPSQQAIWIAMTVKEALEGRP